MYLFYYNNKTIKIYKKVHLSMIIIKLFYFTFFFWTKNNIKHTPSFFRVWKFLHIKRKNMNIMMTIFNKTISFVNVLAAANNIGIIIYLFFFKFFFIDYFNLFTTFSPSLKLLDILFYFVVDGDYIVPWMCLPKTLTFIFLRRRHAERVDCFLFAFLLSF